MTYRLLCDYCDKIITYETFTMEYRERPGNGNTFIYKLDLCSFECVRDWAVVKGQKNANTAQ